MIGLRYSNDSYAASCSSIRRPRSVRLVFYWKMLPHSQQTKKRAIPVSALRCCDWKKTASSCLQAGQFLFDRGSVGSEPTSCVTPAVAPAVLFMRLRNTQVEVASSVYWHVRQVNCNLWESSSSLGYSILEHSEQKRKVICSRLFCASRSSTSAFDPGDAIVAVECTDERR